MLAVGPAPSPGRDSDRACLRRGAETPAALPGSGEESRKAAPRSGAGGLASLARKRRRPCRAEEKTAARPARPPQPSPGLGLETWPGVRGLMGCRRRGFARLRFAPSPGRRSRADALRRGDRRRRAGASASSRPRRATRIAPRRQARRLAAGQSESSAPTGRPSASSPDSAPQAGLITSCSAGPRLPMPERRGEGREVRACKRGTEWGLPVRRIYLPRACSRRAQGLYMARRGCPVGAEISTVPLRVVLLAGAGCAARCALRDGDVRRPKRRRGGGGCPSGMRRAPSALVRRARAVESGCGARGARPSRFSAAYDAGRLERILLVAEVV